MAKDPGDSDSGFVACPFRALTGRWCPGCGLTRATHHLFRGDIAHAVSLNALVVPVIALLATLWWIWLRVATGRGVPLRLRTIRTQSYVAAGVTILVFAIVRNLPGWPLLRGG